MCSSAGHAPCAPRVTGASARARRAPGYCSGASAPSLRPSPLSKQGATRCVQQQATPGLEPGASWRALWGKAPCGRLNITGCCAKLRHSLRLRFVRWRNRYAPCGFAQRLLCLAPRRTRRAVRVSPRSPASKRARARAPARVQPQHLTRRGLRPRRHGSGEAPAVCSLSLAPCSPRQGCATHSLRRLRALDPAARGALGGAQTALVSSAVSITGEQHEAQEQNHHRITRRVHRVV